MADNKSWQVELEEYIRQGEPDEIEKSNSWKTAIGLQDVDGLKISEYLLDTAKEHIEGKISIIEADKRIQSYYKSESVIQSATENNSKCQIGTLNLTLEELALLNILKTEPTVTQKRIAELSGRSERTIKRRTVELQEKGYICRENGKRNGKWNVLIEFD